MPPDPPEDPGYRAALVDLLGLLAHGELTAFSRLAADADMAPGAGERERFARLAIVEFGHYELLRDHLVGLGGSVDAAMAPYFEGFAAFHRRTRPSTWLEAVVKAYVGDGIARDFAVEIAAFLDPRTRALIVAAMAEQERAPVLLELARDGMAAAPPAAADRLALWARRLFGEAVTQAQVVAVEHAALTALLTGQFGGPGLDITAIGELLGRLTHRHTERMELLGLSA